MTNNENENGMEPEDFESGGLEGGDSFDDFEGGNATSPLNNPMVKVGIIVAAIATIIGGIILFGGKEEAKTLSNVRGAGNVSGVPGTDPVTPQMKEAIEEINEEEAIRAARTGGSAIPVPVSSPQATLEVPDLSGAGEEDPLERWRKIQEERQRKEAQQQRPNAPQVDPNAQVIDQLAKSMSAQMQTILDAQVPPTPESEVITSADWLEKREAAKNQKIQEQKAAAAANAQTAAQVLDIIQPAGTIEYAQLITEANSDAPGPVLAQIMSGPLRGARILGTFSTQENYLTLTFQTIVVDGVSYSADAIALDPASANPGLVTEIDRRYFERVILPAAAAFVEGMGEAIAESGSTSVTVSGDTVIEEEEPIDTRQEIFNGIEEASGKVGDILDKEGSKVKPMIKVHAGTAVGILFLQPVTKDPAQDSAKAAQ